MLCQCKNLDKKHVDVAMNFQVLIRGNFTVRPDPTHVGLMVKTQDSKNWLGLIVCIMYERPG